MELEAYTGVDLLETLIDAKRYNSFIASRIDHWSKGCENILDFGAGMGIYCDLLSEISTHRNITAVEIDNYLNSMLQKRGINTVQHIESVEAESKDLVYTVNVLEHIKNDSEAIGNLVRVLKPKGKLYIYVPAIPFLYSSMDKKVGHYRRYTKTSLLSLLKAHNLKLLNIEYVDSLGTLATLLYKLIGDKEGNFNKSQVVVYDTLIFPLSRLLDGLFAKYLVGKNIEVVAEKE